MLLSPQSLAGKLDVEAAVAKPLEDGLGGRHPSCKSSVLGHTAMSGLFVKKALTTCSLLVEKPLTTGGLLAFVGSTLVKESLGMIGLLALMSSFLVKMALVGRRLEAMVLVLPQFIHSLFPVLVGGLLASAASGKNPPSQWRRRE